MSRFVHIRTHSAYSLLEGAIPIPSLVERAVAAGMPALGLTDRNNMFGALEFSEKAANAGLQPLIGVTLSIAMEEEAPGRTPPLRKALPSIVLLARDETGYGNLLSLTSSAYLDRDDSADPFIPLPLLADQAEGLIVLTGGPEGPVDVAVGEGNEALARARLDALREIAGDALYVEVQRHLVDAERRVEPDLLELAYEASLPIVATNQVYFREREDFEAHDALRCIAQGRAVADPDRQQLTPEHFFKSSGDMAAAFADLPEALDATIEIARRCAIRPTTCAPILPRFAGTSVEDEATELRAQAQSGLQARLEAHELAPGLERSDYEERLDYELGVIERMEYPGYFLIVADFIKWAKAQGIPVGPGRGSGAGSVVAWALTVTDLDPLRFDLLFERFLNPDRVSMPDFDIDFCPTGRDAVIGYVREKYGADRVAQIITFGTLQARAVVRDVARVLGMPYGQADKLSKMIPHNPAKPVTLAQAIEAEPRLQDERDSEPDVARLLDISLKLEGLYRHASTHAAGVVIGDRPLVDLVPLYRDPRAALPATQFNMKWVEKAGLVKFDFLGLKTLTVISRAVELLRKQGIAIDIDTLPLDDTKTYDMLSRGETTGIFQLESGGMRTAILGMRPDRFEDIIALVALYRPGPMENIPTYNARKHGQEKPDYIDPKMEPFLRETFGVIVYQEQVMQIAQELAGYSLGEADLLRRAMGKKIQSEMAEQRPRFTSGASERGIPKDKAERIFDLLAKFADYGFNKSHAAAYALVAYQTAYLKANYPIAFFAASMTVDAGNTVKLNDFRQEANRVGIDVLPPCVNRSGVDFDVGEGAIHYALGAIRNVGRHAAEHIVEQRGDRPFCDVWDFASRIDPRIVNKRALESMIMAGCFDGLDGNRARLWKGVDLFLETASKTSDDLTGGQGWLLSSEQAPRPLPEAEAWTSIDQLTKEYEALGSFLSGHPIEAYKAMLDRMNVQTLAEFEENTRNGATAGRVAAVVVGKTERRGRNGNRVGIVMLSDKTAQLECVAFSEVLAENRALLEPGTAVLVAMSTEFDNDLLRARMQSIEKLDDRAKNTQQSLKIFVRDGDPIQAVAGRLQPRGGGYVSIVVLMPDRRGEVELKLPGRYAVTPRSAAAIKTIPGVLDVQYA